MMDSQNGNTMELNKKQLWTAMSTDIEKGCDTCEITSSIGADANLVKFCDHISECFWPDDPDYMKYWKWNGKSK